MLVATIVDNIKKTRNTYLVVQLLCSCDKLVNLFPTINGLKRSILFSFKNTSFLFHKKSILFYQNSV
jgi:hypothetical protein